MKGMFLDASAFNQPLGQWIAAKVTTMQEMYSPDSVTNCCVM
jgi:hypothetical protein